MPAMKKTLPRRLTRARLRITTGGTGEPVRIESWDAMRIDNFHIHQEKISSDAALLTAELDVEASQPTTATVAVTHDGLAGQEASDGTQTLQLDAGMNHVSFPIRIASPKLWYPLGYGPQNRYRFSASIRASIRMNHKVEVGGAEVKTGLRSAA